MRRIALLLLFAAVACASDRTAAIPDPDFVLEQISEMPDLASHVSGSFPVQYRLHVGNHAPVPIRLRQVNVSSVGMNAYEVASTTRPFNVTIGPEQSVDVEFFVSGLIAQSILGANGPVTLHGIVVFDSQWGPFQRSFLLQANERPKK